MEVLELVAVDVEIMVESMVLKVPIISKIRCFLPPPPPSPCVRACLREYMNNFYCTINEDVTRPNNNEYALTFPLSLPL